MDRSPSLEILDAPEQAFEPNSFHQRLAAFNAARLAPTMPHADWQADLQHELQCRLEEGRFLEQLREEVAPWLAKLPIDPDDFVAWFEALERNGPGQHHPLFDWLEHEASANPMRWFLMQEAAGEAGFEDLLAMTQVKLPDQAKLEFARNYWDEMGHGKARGMHARMLADMVAELHLSPAIHLTVWESLALGNTMLGFATNRRYAFHAAGALGVIELTAPARAKKVAAGMRRLGMNGRVHAYFDLHSTLDVLHARAWMTEVLHPLVKEDPRRARPLAEGALMRLVCGQRCFERYSAELRQPLRQAA